jgi:hypothetical protein
MIVDKIFAYNKDFTSRNVEFQLDLLLISFSHIVFDKGNKEKPIINYASCFFWTSLISNYLIKSDI